MDLGIRFYSTYHGIDYSIFPDGGYAINNASIAFILHVPLYSNGKNILNIDFSNYYLKMSIDCYSLSSNTRSYFDNLFSSLILYPINYPNSYFSSKIKTNEEGTFYYFPLKSTQNMSLYQLAIYDNSLSNIESGTNVASIICSFDFNTTNSSDLINQIDSGNVYYKVTMGLDYYEN